MGGGWLAERRWWGWLLLAGGGRHQGGCNRGVSDSKHDWAVPIFFIAEYRYPVPVPNHLTRIEYRTYQ
jgi:hypothetical protein